MPSLEQHPSIEDLLEHAGWLRALARRLVDEASADDLVQETYAAALRSPPPADRPARAWLSRVLKNAARMRARGDSRRARRHEAVTETTAPPETPLDATERLRTQALLCELIEALPAHHRDTVVGLYFEGLSAAELADRLDIEAATVRWRHRQALTLLRRALDQRSGGERRSWLAVLGPFASRPVSGGLVMKTTWTVTIAACLLLLATLAVLVARAGANGDAAPGPGERGRVDHAIAAARVAATENEPLASLHGAIRGEPGTVDVQLWRQRGSQPPEPVRQQRVQDAYRFEIRAAGRYCVTARGRMGAASACDLLIEAGAQVVRDLVLEGANIDVGGTVMDAGGGSIAGAWIVAEQVASSDGLRVARSTVDGSYRLPLRRGPYRLTARADNYAPRSRLVHVAGPAEESFLLNPAAGLEGRIVLPDDQAPAAGASVRIAFLEAGDRATRTVVANDDGRFDVEGLAPGRYRVEAALDGAGASAPTDVTLGLGEWRMITLALAPAGGRVYGQVRDDAGRRVADIEVRLEGIVSRTTRTDADGDYAFDGVPAGSHLLRAAGPEHAEARQRILVGDRARHVDLQLRAGTSITGVVRAGDTPVAGAVVRTSAAESAHDDVTSDADGRFRLPALPAGHVQLVAYHSSLGASDTVTRTLPGESAPVTLSFAVGDGAIVGRVHHASGDAATGARIELTPASAPPPPTGESAWRTVADQRGEYALEGLPAGRYVVRAATGGAHLPQAVFGADARRAVTVIAGQRARVDLTVADRGGDITGQVIDRHGQPIFGAAVWAERESDGIMSPPSLSEIHTYTWNDGAFSLSGLPAGTFSVHAHHPELGTGVVRATAGTSGLDVTLAAHARIDGRAIDRGGRPIPVYELRVAWRARQHDGASVTRSRTVVVRDDDGRFAIDGLPATDRAIVEVRTPAGERARSEPLVLSPGQTRDVTVRVAEPATITGKLVWASDGRPALGLEVAVAGDRALVDGHGRFWLRVEPGRYDSLQVMTRDRGLPPVERAFEIEAGAALDLGTLPVRR